MASFEFNRISGCFGTSWKTGNRSDAPRFRAEAASLHEALRLDWNLPSKA